LRRDSRADVAVLGGGLAGITGALEARRRGARVVLFEPGPIGGT
jgi:glycine/D-amino acid oxidase-like deaminating enzyme